VVLSDPGPDVNGGGAKQVQDEPHVGVERHAQMITHSGQPSGRPSEYTITDVRDHVVLLMAACEKQGVSIFFRLRGRGAQLLF
jgi:hypothetical protein